MRECLTTADSGKRGPNRRGARCNDERKNVESRESRRKCPEIERFQVCVDNGRKAQPAGPHALPPIASVSICVKLVPIPFFATSNRKETFAYDECIILSFPVFTCSNVPPRRLVRPHKHGTQPKGLPARRPPNVSLYGQRGNLWLYIRTNGRSTVRARSRSTAKHGIAHLMMGWRRR